MMDRVIHKHLDKRLDIQEEAEKFIDMHLDMDVDKLIENPEAELARVASDVLTITEGFAVEGVTEGRRFAKDVKARDAQDRPIIIQDTDNPKANEDSGIKGASSV